MNFVRAYDYLVLSRAKLFEWVRALTPEQYVQPFPFGHGSLRATLVHIPGTEWGYQQRLKGVRELPPVSEWEIPVPPHGDDARIPTVSDLERVWSEVSRETRAVLAATTSWNDELRWVGRPPVRDAQPIVFQVTPAEVATQICFHEVHHRAQAMAMLRQLGFPAENLDFSILTWRRGPLEG
jgi:uncharacterized damage-inducible protein DinB